MSVIHRAARPTYHILSLSTGRPPVQEECLRRDDGALRMIFATESSSTWTEECKGTGKITGAGFTEARHDLLDRWPGNGKIPAGLKRARASGRSGHAPLAARAFHNRFTTHRRPLLRRCRKMLCPGCRPRVPLPDCPSQVPAVPETAAELGVATTALRQGCPFGDDVRTGRRPNALK